MQHMLEWLGLGMPKAFVAARAQRISPQQRRMILHTDTQTHRHTDTQTHRHTDTHRHRHTNTHTWTHTHRHIHTDTHTDTHRRGGWAAGCHVLAFLVGPPVCHAYFVLAMCQASASQRTSSPLAMFPSGAICSWSPADRSASRGAHL